MKKLLFAALLGLSLSSIGQNTTTEYSATVLSTNFTIPIIRSNFIKSSSNQKVNISFFRSIGAGVGYSFGRITEVRDKEGKLLSSDMDNTFGAQFGILFASNGSGDSSETVFAPVIGFSVLNFQLGVGYELGSLQPNNERTFITLAYGIPVNKLVKGGFWILKKQDLDPVSKKRGFLKF